MLIFCQWVNTWINKEEFPQNCLNHIKNNNSCNNCDKSPQLLKKHPLDLIQQLKRTEKI
jgi:hypothetical protein